MEVEDRGIIGPAIGIVLIHHIGICSSISVIVVINIIHLLLVRSHIGRSIRRIQTIREARQHIIHVLPRTLNFTCFFMYVLCL